MRRNIVALATAKMLSCRFITLMHAEAVTTSNGTTEVTITKIIEHLYGQYSETIQSCK